MRTLLPNEEELLKNSKLTLTNIRVLYSDQNKNKSIMLEHITSIENEYKSYNFLLVLAGLFGIGGFLTLLNSNKHFMGGFELLILFMIPALISAFLYYITKKNLLIIRSPSSNISIKTIGTTKEELLSVMDKIEMAKNKRLIELKQ